MAYKQFIPDVLSSAEVNTYLMKQAVIVFTNATARTNALGATPPEGMVTYLQDTNTFWYYDGSAWINLGNIMRFASNAARANALPSPTEGMVSYLQDVDELEVYNGASWLRVVVTSDDEGLTVAGNFFANTGKFVANRATATGGSSAGGIDMQIDGNTYGQIFMTDSNTMRFTAAANTFDGGATVAGGLTVDTSSLRVDPSNDVIGIMTASPSTGQYNDWSVDIPSGRVRIGGQRSGGSAGISLGTGTPTATWYNNTAFIGLESTLNSSRVGIWHSGAWRLQVSQDGYVTKSNQPCVYAFNTTSYTLGDNQRLAFNTAVVNRGNRYNATNSFFTCPVDGLYFVHCQVLTQYNTSASDLRIAKDDVRIDAYSGYGLVGGVLSSHKQGHVQGIVDCAAGNQLSIRSVGTIDLYGNAGAGHTSLIIFLLA